MRLKEASGKAAELLSSQTKLQSEISNLTVQNEELEGRLSMSEKKLREANQQIVELQDTVAEETRLKITATNKHKELQNVVEQLLTSVEEEEEAKQMLQSKMLQLTQQVYYTFMLWCSSHFA